MDPSIQPPQTQNQQEPAQVIEPPLNPQSQPVLVQTHSSHKNKIVAVILVLLVLAGIGGAVYYFGFVSKNSSKEDDTQGTKESVERVDLTPETAFARMIEMNQKVNTYHVSVDRTTKSRSGKNANDYDKKYMYEADVDVSDLSAMKLRASFDVNRAGVQAKGETIWIGEDVYIKLNEALLTDYRDIACSNPAFRTAKSPTLAALKAGFVKTIRSDQTLSCGRAAYEDLIGPITFSNAPFGDLPLFNGLALGEMHQRGFTAAQNGQYGVYDGTETDLNGVRSYSYNVTIENYKIAEMSKILVDAAGFVNDDMHGIGFGDGDMGQGSPGRYLKVWVNADTGNLLRIQSIVDTQNVDIVFSTTLDFSKINESVNIQAPPK